MYKIETTGDLLMVVGTTHQKALSKAEPSADARLVDAVTRGDEEAFANLYRLYSPMVHGILLARVPFREVDDLVQDVFLLAFRKIRSLRDRSSFGPWLAMITRNRANDFHRRSKRAEELPVEILVRSRSEAEADAEKILRLVRGLPEAYRETLVLRLVEGMTGPEIAARTGLTAASVRVNLHRGMKILREALGMESGHE